MRHPNPVVGPMNSFVEPSGQVWNVEVVHENDWKNGRQTRDLDPRGPIVKFYDGDYAGKPRFGPLGQMASSYYLSTLLGEDGVSPECDRRGVGLTLHGGVPKWTVSGPVMDQVRNWLRVVQESLPRHANPSSVRSLDYAAEVARELVRRLGWSPEEAASKITLYQQSLERYGRKARQSLSAVGMLKKDWGAVRAAILEVNARQRARGTRPAARPRPRPVRQERDPVPAWARQEGAAGWMILSMERKDADLGESLLVMGGRTFGQRPGGWFAEVEGRTGASFGFSKLDGESHWACDSAFGPKMEPLWANGEGQRGVGTRVAREPLHSWLNQAIVLRLQGDQGPYDPRLMAPADVPGQTRLFNPLR